ncbi:MAG TPA: CHRD domain-containing protein, partial [Candidatus Binatia bacterium]|nr:CHRD domain-containing protein [Candidatus Binatia bacterium]
DDLVNAHIHCCAPPGNIPAVNNASVRWGFIGTPFNNTTGINLVTPFASPGVGGTFQGVWDANEGQATTLAAQLPGILAGLSYINFHTTQFTGGEIRGQILLVPEPSTLIMMGLGFLGLRIARWFRKP